MDLLKKERRWCVRGADKRPFAGENVPGKVNDKSTWLSFEAAEEQ